MFDRPDNLKFRLVIRVDNEGPFSTVATGLEFDLNRSTLLKLSAAAFDSFPQRVDELGSHRILELHCRLLRLTKGD